MPITSYFQNITLTAGQQEAVQRISEFLESDKDVFILKGYAGTGKTTLLKGVVQYLNAKGYKKSEKHEGPTLHPEHLIPGKIFQIMAPTGRAAKILTEKTGYRATTIHKAIYNFKELKTIENPENPQDGGSYKYYFALNPLQSTNAVLLVDEASMISDKFDESIFFRFGSGLLLTDLINYAGFDFPQNNPKIIFIGDPAQLPPINMHLSPALDEKYLKEKFDLKVETFELTQVIRQAGNSEILTRANQIRKNLTPWQFKIFDVRPDQKEILEYSQSNLWDYYQNIDLSKIIITFKNSTSYRINQSIRNRLYNNVGNLPLPIREGDIILVGANNYLSGVMNGEFGVVVKVSDIIKQESVGFKKKGGTSGYEVLQWREISLLMDNKRMVKGYMLENFLTSDESKLTTNQRQALFVEFRKRHPNLKPGSEEFKEKLKNDPYFNALLLKYGYAVTCHKAQGGEWENAFVDFNDFNQGKNSDTFYRWAYTAMTRAKKRMFVNNPLYFHSFSEMQFISKKIWDTYKTLHSQTQTKIITLSTVHKELLNRFGLSDYPEKLQYHFIKVYELLKEIGVEIDSYKMINYEIRYGLSKGAEKVMLKFWRNKKNEVKDKFQQVPSHTTSDKLFGIISIQLEKLPSVSIQTGTIPSENYYSAFTFEEKMAREKPVLKTLFDKLYELTQPLNIQIVNVEHFPYKERYFFKRGPEQAVLDFQYNAKAFFSTVTPLERECNSQKLFEQLEKIIQKLRQ